ncbi:MAG: hypothetical protein IAE89_02925 [Anaerolineae bacterium]|nr:hypothetical protein [Anaerolineae bacterium]
MTDQQLLASSQAGLRLIAMLTFFNSGKFGRLRAYIKEHYTDAALESELAAARLAALKVISAAHGRLRVRQVVIAEKHHTLTLLQSEDQMLYAADLICEQDYPHKIAAFDLAELGTVS